MNAEPAASRPALARFFAGYSLPATTAYFIAGALITALFSASLAAHAPHTSLANVLIVGMVVPSFTWLMQLTGSAFLMRSAALRPVYWGELGRACVVGSAALLPAALANLDFRGAAWGRPENTPTLLWLSALNVLASVVCMGALLFIRTTARRIASGWAISWCVTITLNMTLFLWVSRNWWPAS